MGEDKSRVAFFETEDRKTGVVSSMNSFGVDSVKNKDVLIKPNFNTIVHRTSGR